VQFAALQYTLLDMNLVCSPFLGPMPMGNTYSLIQ
jgi:hypothetical protein